MFALWDQFMCVYNILPLCVTGCRKSMSDLLVLWKFLSISSCIKALQFLWRGFYYWGKMENRLPHWIIEPKRFIENTTSASISFFCGFLIFNLIFLSKWMMPLYSLFAQCQCRRIHPPFSLFLVFSLSRSLSHHCACWYNLFDLIHFAKCESNHFLHLQYILTSYKNSEPDILIAFQGLRWKYTEDANVYYH